jgi:hypothetical protein
MLTVLGGASSIRIIDSGELIILLFETDDDSVAGFNGTR